MRSVVVVAAFVWLGQACTTLPQPAPVLGAPDQRLSFAISEGLPYIPTRATVSGPETAPVVVRQHLESHESAPAQLLFDPRVSVAHRLRDRIDASGHLGWWMSGVELRMRSRGDAGEAPLLVAVGAQVDAMALALDLTRAAIWDVRAQVSIHPSLARSQAILGAGVSAGRQKHDIDLPRDVRANDPDFRPSLVSAARAEARIEGVVGLSLAFGVSRIALAAQPFYVIAHGAPSTIRCNDCVEGLRVDSLEASWGAALTLTWLASVK